MMIRFLLPALLLAACSGAPAPVAAPAAEAQQAPAPNPYPACGPVTAKGWCGVTFGQAPEQAESEADIVLNRSIAFGAHDPTECAIITGPEPDDFAFLFVQRQVSSVFINVPGVVTAEGVGVGASEAKLMSAYGARAAASPNRHEPGVTDVVVRDGDARLIFEIEAGKVRLLKAGIAPTVDYAIPCR